MNNFSQALCDYTDSRHKDYEQITKAIAALKAVAETVDNRYASATLVLITECKKRREQSTCDADIQTTCQFPRRLCPH